MSGTDALEAALRNIEELEAALRFRDEIGIAKGMLMLRYGLTRDQAFAYLVRRSQADNVKVHDLASMVIQELRSDPGPAPLT